MKRRHLIGTALLTALGEARADVMQCVASAKPGGGFDLTCQLVRDMLSDQHTAPRIVYQPGGIGALTYSEVVRGARAEPRELIAFSSGTLLNIAQGRFGPWRPERIRWVAAVALDHGVVAVHRDAPWRSLRELLDAVQRDRSSVAFAAGGTIGSQDWMKAALLARSAGISHKSLRVVAFEGGGDALRALSGRHVQVLCGDAAELSEQLAQGGPLRLLATLSERRLAGPLASVPTAFEQGFEVRWPILRGVYASADFPSAELAVATNRIAGFLRTPSHEAAARKRGLEPLSLIGSALQGQVEVELTRFKQATEQFGLAVRR